MTEATPLRCEVLTLFPEMVSGYASQSILGNAQEQGLVQVRAVDIRGFAPGKHRVTDDAPYGGGAGMVMKPEPIVGAIEASRAHLASSGSTRVAAYLMGPRGRVLDQRLVKELALLDALILVCGRYEGVDERVLPFVDGEISLGDFVLTGGELAALAIVDAVARLRPGVLGNDASAQAESFEGGLLEHPHYTRPPVFREASVPAVLQSGDHARIARWRRWHSLQATQVRRPDLLARTPLSDEDRKLLSSEEPA